MTTETNTTSQIIKHNTSGDTYAIRTYANGTRQMTTELHHTEQNLPFDDYEYDNDASELDLSDYSVIRSE